MTELPVWKWPSLRVRPDQHTAIIERAGAAKRSPRAELELLLEKALADGEDK